MTRIEAHAMASHEGESRLGRFIRQFLEGLRYREAQHLAEQQLVITEAGRQYIAEHGDRQYITDTLFVEDKEG